MANTVLRNLQDRLDLEELRLSRLRPVVTGTRLSEHTIEVIDMPWWETVLFLIAVGVAIWGFISMVGVRTRFLTRKTTRTAQDLYDDYADSSREQRRYAREHGGEWSDREDKAASLRSNRP